MFDMPQNAVPEKQICLLMVMVNGVLLRISLIMLYTDGSENCALSLCMYVVTFHKSDQICSLITRISVLNFPRTFYWRLK